MPTLYLHIGTPKTGTTALQNFLSENNAVLEKYHIHYPDFGFKYEGIGYHRNGHFLAAPFITEQGEKDFLRPSNEYEAGLEKLRELKKSYDKIILSDENMWRNIWSRKDYWRRVKNDFNQLGFDIKIIVYLRRQDQFLESYWAQQVKEYATCTLEEFMESSLFSSCPLDYYTYLNYLSDIFGKDNLIPRVYENAQYLGDGGTIHSDFLNIFGISDMQDFFFGQTFYNPSLSGNYLEIKRILNYIGEFRSASHPISGYLKKAQKKNIFNHNFKEYSYLTPRQRRDFLAAFSESNQKVARRYLGRNDGILFYDEIKDAPKYTVSESELLPDILLVFGQAMNDLMKENKTMKKQLNELQKYSIFYRLKQKVRRR